MEFRGTSMEYPWNSECHGVPWSIGGVPWSVNEVPWNAMEFHGVRWSIEGVPWNAMELHEVALEVHGILSSIDGVPWNDMEFHGVSMECHRNSLIKQLINLLTTCSGLHFLLDRKIENIWKPFKSKIVCLV